MQDKDKIVANPIHKQRCQKLVRTEKGNNDIRDSIATS